MRKFLSWLCDCLFDVPTHRYGRQAGFAAWIPAIIAGGEAIMGNVNANRASGQQETAQEQANAIQQGELGIAQTQEGQATGLYDRYINMIEPAQNQFIEEASKPLDPNLYAGEAIANVAQNAATQQGALTRQQAKYGINPDSGAAVAADSNFKLGTAATEAGAANTARQYAANETLNRLKMISDMGNPLIGASSGLEEQGAGTMGGVGGYYSGLANRYGNLAQGYGQEAGYGLAGFMNYAPMYSGPGSPGAYNPLNAPPDTSAMNMPIYQPPSN